MFPLVHLQLRFLHVYQLAVEGIEASRCSYQFPFIELPSVASIDATPDLHVEYTVLFMGLHFVVLLDLRVKLGRTRRRARLDLLARHLLDLHVLAGDEQRLLHVMVLLLYVDDASLHHELLVSSLLVHELLREGPHVNRLHSLVRWRPLIVH